LNQVHQTVLAVELRFRQLQLAATSSALEPMRPNAPHDPAVEPVEERSDVGPLVVVDPTPQDRIELIDQLLGRYGHAPLGKLTHLIHKTLDRSASGRRTTPPNGHHCGSHLTAAVTAGLA